MIFAEPQRRRLDKLGVQHDLGVENLRNWAVFLGIFRRLREFCFVEVGHFGAQRQSRTADAKPFALRFESDGCLGKVTNLDELGV